MASQLFTLIIRRSFALLSLVAEPVNNSNNSIHTAPQNIIITFTSQADLRIGLLLVPAVFAESDLTLDALLVKVKVWVLVIALLTRLEQQQFTISKVAADWHELMIPWRIMRPSIARDGEQMDQRCSTQTYHRPNQRTRPSPRSP